MIAHQIPPSILQRVVDFLRAGRTGQIALNIHQGRILNAEIKERVPVADE